MKSIICACILASFVLLNCKAGGAARVARSEPRSEFISAPLREVGGRKLHVVVPKHWRIVSVATNPKSESSKPLCYLELRRQTGNAVETAHFFLFVDPAFTGNGFVGHFPVGPSLTTDQGYHGFMKSYSESNSIETTFTFDYVGAPAVFGSRESDVLYSHGFLYCEIDTSHMTERETERFATYIFRNLRWER